MCGGVSQIGGGSEAAGGGKCGWQSWCGGGAEVVRRWGEAERDGGGGGGGRWRRWDAEVGWFGDCNLEKKGLGFVWRLQFGDKIDRERINYWWEIQLFRENSIETDRLVSITLLRRTI